MTRAGDVGVDDDDCWRTEAASVDAESLEGRESRESEASPSFSLSSALTVSHTYSGSRAAAAHTHAPAFTRK